MVGGTNSWWLLAGGVVIAMLSLHTWLKLIDDYRCHSLNVETFQWEMVIK